MVYLRLNRTLMMGTTTIRWLVSCKHKAHTGQSVTDKDEENISDRIRTHNADGFMGFYSTIISSPLNRRLKGLKSSFEVMIFDNERIENILLDAPQGRRIANRYFPISYAVWENSNYKPSEILHKYEPLSCKYCGIDLLSKKILEKGQGIVVFVKDSNYYKTNMKARYVDVYWSCKGRCDEILQRRYGRGYFTGWEDISDIIIPAKYIMWNMAILNRLRNGEDVYKDEAFEKLKEFIIIISQLVLKEQTDSQIERLKRLNSLPPL